MPLDSATQRWLAAAPAFSAAVPMAVMRSATDAREKYNPLASPSAAASLRGLPDTLILSCECDPLRDEGEEYARRLALDGGNVRLERLAGTIHGAMHMTAVTPAAQQVFEHCARLWDEPAA